MKKLLALLLIITIVGCSPEKKETPDYAEMLKIKEAMERGSGDAIKRYGEIIGDDKLANIESDPAFIELKDQALADVNNLIVEALENNADKNAILNCIKQYGADSPECAQQVQQVTKTTSPRLEQYDAELSKFFANHLAKKDHLPKNAANCQAVHIGIFQVLVEGDTMVISRDNDTQIEQFRGEVRKEKISWVNDCTYHLVLIRNQSDTTQFRGPGGYLDDSFVEIVHVADDHYVYKLFSSSNSQEGELLDIGKVFVKK